MFFKNPHKSVKEVDVGWRASTLFPKISQWCWNGFKTRLLDGGFGKWNFLEPDDWHSESDRSRYCVCNCISIRVAERNKKMKVVAHINIYVLWGSESPLYKYKGSKNGQEKPSIITEALWLCSFQTWCVRFIVPRSWHHILKLQSAPGFKQS